MTGLRQPDFADDVLITHRLWQRPERETDRAEEARLLHRLNLALVADPEAAIAGFPAAAMKLCRADAAGISVAEEVGIGTRFSADWVVGAYTDRLSGSISAEGTPSGLAKEAGHSIVISRPARVFPELASIDPPIVEALITPLFDREERFLGTIWAVHTREEGKFCAGDVRILERLGVQLVLAFQLMGGVEGESVRPHSFAFDRGMGTPRNPGSVSAARKSELQEDVLNFVEASTFLRNMLDSSVDCIKVLDPAGVIRYVNDGGVKLLSADNADQVKGRNWLTRWAGGEAREAQAALSKASAGAIVRFQGAAPDLKGVEKHWDVHLTPIRFEGNGDKSGFVLAITRDITEQRRAEEQRALLTAEMNHRVKNILTVVSAIANQTFRPPTTLEKASELFANRLSALAKAQEILTRSAWSGAEIGQVIEGALAAHEDPAHDTRFFVEGPTLELPSNKALSLALAVHELATNAMKYGALSSPEGRVGIRWSIIGEDHALVLKFEWREQGGPHVVRPTSRGFGSRLIERALAAEFNGKVQLNFAPDGLVCTLTAPLKYVTALP